LLASLVLQVELSRFLSFLKKALQLLPPTSATSQEDQMGKLAAALGVRKGMAEGEAFNAELQVGDAYDDGLTMFWARKASCCTCQRHIPLP
jgi:hypothetical protein